MIHPINGYSKDRIVQTILANVSSRPSGYSFAENGRLEFECQYRNSDGNKCVIGAFIPDEIYTEEMESTTVNVLLAQFPYLKSNMPLPLTALERLQQLHDKTPPANDPKPALLAWIERFVEDKEEKR